ncbi:MAG: hypothetical protein RLZZ126_834 [Pseudomonadota bacterium]|jgi:polysaccharide biosynthesis/export protein
MNTWLVIIALALIPASLVAQTQSESSQVGQGASSRILEAPIPGTGANADSRVFSPSRIFGRPSASGIDYDLKERSPGPAPQMRLSTTIETKVENKTTNHIGSGGDGGAGRSADPPPPPNPQVPPAGFEFSDFVRTSVGSELPMFGLGIAAGDARGNASVDPLTVPADYRVGPGDQLVVRAWGQIDIDFQGAVDRSGQIFLPKIGNVMVAGQKLSDLSALLRTTIGRQYRAFELTVTLGSLREIQYYVMGFAKSPGIYTAPSTASALQALLQAGGISSAGDPRKVEVRRAGTTIATVDAYRFLIDGDKSSDPQLQPGDILYVPASRGHAAIAGSVRRPAIFHLNDGMTLADLVKASGGIALSQPNPSIRLERFRNGRRHVEHLEYGDVAGKREVRDGDLYMVLPVSPRIENSITLRGNVAQPLRQPYRDSMKVSDLLASSDLFVRAATWVQRNGRESLQKLGDANRDSEFRRDFPDMEWGYAAIERVDPATQSMSILTFNLWNALNGDGANNLPLKPGDVVVVFAKADFSQPQFKKLRMVRVEGEVKFPGIYPVEVGETLQQVFDRAGGLTDQAYVFGTIFSRSSARKMEEQRLRQVSDRIEQDYLRYLAGRSRNAVGNDVTGGGVNATEFEAVRSLVARLRAHQPEGRIPLNLRGVTAGVEHFPKIALEDDDRVLIPPRPATVTVVGSVFQEGSLLWVSDWGASAYIDYAGGFRRHADTSGVVVMHADGTVRQIGGWFGRSEPIHPGDTIVVPENVELTSWTRIFRDWSQIFYQLGLGAAAIKILHSSL